MDRGTKVWMAAGAALIVGFTTTLLRDRGAVGRVYAFEVDGAPLVTIFGGRHDDGKNLQTSVITWDIAGGRRRCSVGWMFGGFVPLAAAGRHLWVDRSSTNWTEIALWDLATCEERFDAAHFRGATRDDLSFGTGSTRPVDPASGRLFLDRGYALDVDGGVVDPPDDRYAMILTERPRERAACRSRRHTPACDAAPFCAGEVGGRVQIAPEAELGAIDVGPTFAGARLLGSPGADAPCVRVLTDGPRAAVLVRHEGGSGAGGAAWPAGVARVDAAGSVRWNVPAADLALAGEVIAVQPVADDRLWIVAADDGWRLTGGYRLSAVRLAGADGAVVERVALP